MTDPLIEAVFAAVEEAKNRRLAEARHMKLGELTESLDFLSGDDRNLPVVFESGAAPSNPHSYRGYYSDLSFESGGDPVGTSQFLQQLRDLDGEMFQGWKGGDFTMGIDTWVWNSDEGMCSGLGIVGVHRGTDAVVLLTAKTDR